MAEIITKPRGTIDYLNENKVFLDYILNFLDEKAIAFGAKKIDVPLFENGKLFTRGVGESTDIVTKEMFHLENKGEHDYILRPEFTASINRAVIENKQYASPDLPLKYCYHGPVFRYERPQAGRYRQFNQFGIEFLDAKIDFQTQLDALLLFYNAASELLNHNLLLKINFLGDFSSRERYKKVLKDFYKDKISTMCEDCKRRYEINPLRILDCKIDHDIEINKDAPKLSDYISEEEKELYQNVLKVLDNLGINYIEDPKLVRGLDYYTGLVFALYDPFSMELGAIGGGGQYDNLMKELGNIDFEGIGFSYGVERLLLSLSDDVKKDILDKVNYRYDYFIIDLRSKKDIKPVLLSYRLREDGFKIDSSSYSKALNGSLKMADRQRSKYVLIFDDYNENKVIVKNMKERTQEILDCRDIVSLVNTLKKEQLC